jgi:hypothetical protein
VRQLDKGSIVPAAAHALDQLVVSAHWSENLWDGNPLVVEPFLTNAFVEHRGDVRGMVSASHMRSTFETLGNLLEHSAKAQVPLPRMQNAPSVKLQRLASARRQEGRTFGFRIRRAPGQHGPLDGEVLSGRLDAEHVGTGKRFNEVLSAGQEILVRDDIRPLNAATCQGLLKEGDAPILGVAQDDKTPSNRGRTAA